MVSITILIGPLQRSVQVTVMVEFELGADRAKDSLPTHPIFYQHFLDILDRRVRSMTLHPVTPNIVSSPAEAIGTTFPC